MSDSVQPPRRQPTRLCRPWDSPGKNTGVGCHFLLQCMKVKRESEVAQLCPTLSDPMDCNLPGSSAHGIFPGKSTGVGCHCLHRLLQLVCIENHVNSQGKWFILHNNHRYSVVTFQHLSILKFMFHRKLVKQIGL